MTLLVASAGHGGEILVNRGFENANHSLNWTVVAPVSVTQYPNSFNSPGPVPTGNGPWGLDIVNNQGPFAQGNAAQTVTVAPGTYQIIASVWARVFDNSIDTGFSRARFRLLVDNVQVEQIDLVGPNTTGSGWTPWTKLETQTHTLAVTSSIGVFLQMRADGSGGVNNWGQVSADVFSLDAVLIPEPSALLLLATAAIPLALRPRRRMTQ